MLAAIFYRVKPPVRLADVSSDAGHKGLAAALHSVMTAVRGQEITLAFLDVDGFAAAGQCAGTVGDEQRHKGFFARCTVEIPVFYINGKILALCKMAAEILLLRRAAASHIQRLFNVQGAGLAVRTHAPVIVNTIGYIGVLLHLGNDDALADGVQRAGRDKKAVAFMYRHGVQHLGQGVIFPQPAWLFKRKCHIECCAAARRIFKSCFSTQHFCQFIGNT